MYTYGFRPEARRQLHTLPLDVRRLLIRKLDYFISSDNPLSFAKRLKNFSDGQYRFRVGDYRIIFDLVKDTIVILSVGHRREIYKT
jgi:mRNA interferase RelE/StbE